MTAFKHGPKPVIGLIGAIGAGKSAAARCFAARGGHIIDADALGHDALRRPDVIAALVARWGDIICQPDGTLDRRTIARIVFADPVQRNALEQVVFPYIARRTQEEIAAGQAHPQIRFIVLDAAVLLEAGWRDRVDKLVYVDAPPELRLIRLATRSGWTASDLAAREAAQWPAEKKLACADAVLTNTTGIDELQKQVDQLLMSWQIDRSS